MYEKIYNLSPLYKKMGKVTEEYEAMLPQDEKIPDLLEMNDLGLANQSHYLRVWGGYPVYQNTDISFFSEPEILIRDIQEQLQKAQKFIFLECYVCEDSVIWKGILDILQERASQGVEVRVLYDGTGSKSRSHDKYIERLRHKKIKCRVFHSRKGSSRMMNYSDYRKTLVIDGRFAYTGDYEFTKDQFHLEKEKQEVRLAALRLTGDAVRSFSLDFLKMWNAAEGSSEDPVPYLLKTAYRAAESGFVQPFGTNPMSQEQIGKTVYRNMIRNARQYIYLTLPEGVTEEMQQELLCAAKRGVRIYLIVPGGRKEKKPSWEVTGMIRFFRDTTSRLKMRMLVCDDQAAVVGCIHTNRSAVHHMFENGCWFALCRTVISIKNEFEKVLPDCEESGLNLK